MTIRQTATHTNRLAAMLRKLSYLIGAVTGAGGLAMIPAALVSVAYREWATAGQIAVAAAIAVVIGFVMWRVLGIRSVISAKEGFAAVGLAWFFLALAGALPYLLTRVEPNFTNAFFESASGLTTTGASIFTDPGSLPRGVLIWRALTQWIGGMGIIVLGVAVFPLLGVGGVQLARAESPGPQPDRLTPRFRETAKRLWLVYAVITLIEVVLLAAGDMSLFQAFAHALTTMSTGGFGTEASSIGGFSPYTQWVIIGFMIVAGTSFALHFRAWRAPIEYARNNEFRYYAAMLFGAFVIIAGGVWANGHAAEIEEAIRVAAFSAVAVITTTGYVTADWTQWVSGLQIFIVGLMFLGGMAGSTAGAVKTFRIGVLTRAASNDLRRIVRPRGVFITRFGGKPVPDPIVESVQSFFLFYMFLFMTGTFLFGFIESTLGADIDLVTSVSAVASALGNIGPGLGDVGPVGNYAGLPAPGKWLLSFLMIAGRLEIFPVLLLFTRDLWRR